MNIEESNMHNENDDDLNLILFDYFYEIPGYSEHRNISESNINSNYKVSDKNNLIRSKAFIEQIDKEAEKFFLKYKHHEERLIKEGIKSYDDRLLIIRDVFNIKGTASSILNLIKACRSIIARWLKNREGRYISIKAKNQEININKKKDIKKAINSLKELQENGQHLLIKNNNK